MDRGVNRSDCEQRCGQVCEHGMWIVDVGWVDWPHREDMELYGAVCCAVLWHVGVGGGRGGVRVGSM